MRTCTIQVDCHQQELAQSRQIGNQWELLQKYNPGSLKFYGNLLNPGRLPSTGTCSIQVDWKSMGTFTKVQSRQFEIQWKLAQSRQIAINGNLLNPGRLKINGNLQVIQVLFEKSCICLLRKHAFCRITSQFMTIKINFILFNFHIFSSLPSLSASKNLRVEGGTDNMYFNLQQITKLIFSPESHCIQSLATTDTIKLKHESTGGSDCIQVYYLSFNYLFS